MAAAGTHRGHPARVATRRCPPGPGALGPDPVASFGGAGGSGPVRAVDVTSSAPLRVPLPHLVGWHGGLTPRIAVLAEEGGPGGEPLVGIELVGDGVALLCLPAHGH